MNNDRIVKWKCPECGNYHKWVWSTYDIFSGEITMTCDNPECGVTSKMYMIVEKGGNATAFVSAFNGNADNSQVEEKLRRATEKVMNSQTEVDISRVLIEGDYATIMGVKYQRIEEPKPQTLYEICSEWCDDESNPTVEELVNRIEDWLPDEIALDGLPGDASYSSGWNDCLKVIGNRLR